jgi:predicted dehydrogenase
MDRTQGRGADAVIITAAGGDADMLNATFDSCRRKGRVVLVGDVPIQIVREKIYRKELDFLISTSYGPGRYDPEYEEKGHDYPLAYVRWTEGRNLGEVLRQISMGKLKVVPLIDKKLPIKQASEAYAALRVEPRPIGVLLQYEPAEQEKRADHWYLPKRAPVRGNETDQQLKVGVVGFGGYFRSMLLPLLRHHKGFALTSVCARNPLSVRAAVEKDGFERGTTDYRELVNDPSVDVVYVATRHDLHFPVARDAILAGKSVFVEKPMTMTVEQGRELAALVSEHKALLTVGFNRRFSPHAVALRKALSGIAHPKTILYRVNAGVLPPNHWSMDPDEGGGRLLGEGVHFFDFLSFLAGSEPTKVNASFPGGKSIDQACINVEFAEGSVGCVVYTGEGDSAAGKERIEVFAGGSTFIIDDFRAFAAFGKSSAKSFKTRTVEKGQTEQLANFHAALSGEAELGVTAQDGLRATWCVEQALRN